MTDRLKGKNIFITGASGGLGERIAYFSAAEGAQVILAARSKARLQTVREKSFPILGHRAALLYWMSAGQRKSNRFLKRPGRSTFLSTMQVLEFLSLPLKRLLKT